MHEQLWFTEILNPPVRYPSVTGLLETLGDSPHVARRPRSRTRLPWKSWSASFSIAFFLLVRARFRSTSQGALQHTSKERLASLSTRATKLSVRTVRPHRFPGDVGLFILFCNLIG